MLDLSKNNKGNYVHIGVEPKPVITHANGKKCWEIKSIKDDVVYRIWAESYQQALELLPMIESF